MELKVLILFILRRLPQAATWEELTDATLLTDTAIGYFDFSECMTDLVRTEHIAKSDDGYTVTEKGRENGEAMESSLPYSVRVRAEKAAAEYGAAGAKVYTDYRDLLKDPDIDVVHGI